MGKQRRPLAQKPKKEMTMEEFKVWLKQFDMDGDGCISKDELREAIRCVGVWFTTWKSRHGLLAADLNRNGFVDDYEIQYLVAFAHKELGLKIDAF